MCGVVGIWSLDNLDHEAIVTNMSQHIFSRGPDGSGVWSDVGQGLTLAHRRLAILDVSEAGHQPMISKCKRYVLSYNGEIYNHLDLRKIIDIETRNSVWDGHSDTETLLACISLWGLEATLQKINGMFAFALWDVDNSRLFLARDRLGEKPMYYGRLSKTFCFGSQLNIFSAHPEWIGEISRDSLELFMRYGFVPAPKTIYKNFYKLQAGHYIEINKHGAAIRDPVKYWGLASENLDIDQTRSADNCEYLEDLLVSSVQGRMISDVPLGAFLSGGIDSSLVVALMQSLSERPVKTFSIGFKEKKYNEANNARSVADYLGTDHSEIYVSPADLLDSLPRLVEACDEPFADPSQVPTLLLCELAQKDVTVALSGDGGDELFFGYGRYFSTLRLWRRLKLVPRFLRLCLSQMIDKLPNSILTFFLSLVPVRFLPDHSLDRLLKFRQLLEATDFDSFYETCIFLQSNHPDSIVIGTNETESCFKLAGQQVENYSIPNKMMFTDISIYLPDNILTKVDRASMSVSLETRVPLLDHRIAEFAWKLPFSEKYRDGQGKHILRKILYKYVPREIIDRPKKGFGMPIEEWLTGPLSEWVDEIIGGPELVDQGYLNAELVRKMWLEHVTGARRWHAQIWRVLIFQLWLKSQTKNKQGARP